MKALAAKGVTVRKGHNGDTLAWLIGQIEVGDAAAYQAIIGRSVSTLTLPADLPSIDDYAFAFWGGWSAIVFLGTPKSIAGSGFLCLPQPYKNNPTLGRRRGSGSILGRIERDYNL